MSDPYINFYTSDFLGGTSGMTAATKGVYITLLCQMYEAEGPLTQSWETLARRCGCTKSAFKKAVEMLVDDGKMVVSDDGLWSPKCEKHIALRRERRNSASAAAKKRWEKSEEKQGASSKAASATQCQPEPEPDIKEDTNVSSKKRKRASRLDDDWFLPQDWGEWAMSQGMAEKVVRDQADRFKDYWVSQSGSKGVKLDWQATWRNWVRRAKDDQTSSPRKYSQHGKPDGASAAKHIIAKINREAAA